MNDNAGGDHSLNHPESAAGAGAVAIPPELTVNGQHRHVAIDPRITLLDLLRETLGLTVVAQRWTA